MQNDSPPLWRPSKNKKKHPSLAPSLCKASFSVYVSWPVSKSDVVLNELVISCNRADNSGTQFSFQHRFSVVFAHLALSVMRTNQGSVTFKFKCDDSWEAVCFFCPHHPLNSSTKLSKWCKKRSEILQELCILVSVNDLFNMVYFLID